jgi:hypothetical protein
LVSLTNLQSLRFQQYIIRRLGPPSWPARLVFPHTNYIREFKFLLPSLSHLSRIEIFILADILPVTDGYLDSDLDSDSSEWDFTDSEYDVLDSPPKMKVDYFFSVIRSLSGAYVVLDRAHIDDRCEFSFILDRYFVSIQVLQLFPAFCEMMDFYRRTANQVSLKSQITAFIPSLLRVGVGASNRRYHRSFCRVSLQIINCLLLEFLYCRFIEVPRVGFLSFTP